MKQADIAEHLLQIDARLQSFDAAREAVCALRQVVPGDLDALGLNTQLHDIQEALHDAMDLLIGIASQMVRDARARDVAAADLGAHADEARDQDAEVLRFLAALKKQGRAHAIALSRIRKEETA